MFPDLEGKYIIDPNLEKQIIEIKCRQSEDYTSWQTGQICDPLYEFRYLYGNNMDETSSSINNSLLDNRLVYGVEHEENGRKYYNFCGVISEDGENSFSEITPLGMKYLPEPLGQFENSEEEPISKAYFRGYGDNIDEQTLGIIKTKNGIRVVLYEMQYDRNSKFIEQIGFKSILDEVIPAQSERIISTEELNRIIELLTKKNLNNKFIESVCRELQSFIQRKERKRIYV